jgi:hypothetical protein
MLQRFILLLYVQLNSYVQLNQLHCVLLNYTVMQMAASSSKPYIGVAEQALSAHSLKLVLQVRALHTYIKHC